MPQTYTVQPGDYLTKIARQFGFTNWRTIYDHPSNASFRSLRPNPNVIYAGDQLHIPDLQNPDEPADTGGKRTWKVVNPKTHLRIVLRDKRKNPIANADYELTVDGLLLTGKTDGGGKLDQRIAVGAGHASVIAWPDGKQGPCIKYEMAIGALDPVEETTGVQARLNNLGYRSGPVDGIVGPLTQGATRRFQTDYGLAVDGIAGPITKGKLKDVYGS